MPNIKHCGHKEIDMLRNNPPSCCLHQILALPSERLSRNGDSSDQVAFFQSSVAPGVVFCCCRFDVLCIQRHLSPYVGCNEYLFELLLLSYQLEAV